MTKEGLRNAYLTGHQTPVALQKRSRAFMHAQLRERGGRRLDALHVLIIYCRAMRWMVA
jgi:hypothetical protein